MKRYYDSHTFDSEKNKEKKRRDEDRAGGFRCSHCKQWVVINPFIGTANRNHCNLCLWSKHVDIAKGDRKATCQAGMQPIALTFKHEGTSKQGEIMLVHLCAGCSKISINRIARDDIEDHIMSVFTDSQVLQDELRRRLASQGIHQLGKDELPSIRTQLFGM